MVVTPFPYRSSRVYPGRSRLILLSLAVASPLVRLRQRGRQPRSSRSAPVAMKTVSGPGFTFKAEQGEGDRAHAALRERAAGRAAARRSSSRSRSSGSSSRFAPPSGRRRRRSSTAWPSGSPRASAESSSSSRRPCVSRGLRGRQYEIGYEREGVAAAPAADAAPQPPHRVPAALSLGSRRATLPEACAGLEASFKVSR